MPFPLTPAIDDEHTIGTTTWRWTGAGWQKLVPSGPGTGSSFAGAASYFLGVQESIIVLDNPVSFTEVPFV